VIADQLRSLLENEPAVAVAVLFGSTARGEQRQASDIDLAVVWHAERPADVSALLARIERAVGRTVDLVELDDAPPQLRFEIAREGRLLKEREPDAWARLRARAMIDWWDFAPIARTIHQAAIARLREQMDGSR
jgi:predicted nucleotidyltransferase